MTTTGPASPSSREARFRATYEATYDDLLRFVQRRVHPSHAEDVAAEVYLVAWRRLDAVPEGDETRPWLFGVARATILNHRRGSRRRDALAVRLADTALAGAALANADAAGLELATRRLDLAAAWNRLSSGEQEAISLSVWDGLTSVEAGGVLGCSPTAYRIRLSRARRALRRHLDAASPHPASPHATSPHAASPDAADTSPITLEGPPR